MKNYRITETGVVIPHNELSAFFPNVSFAGSDVVEPEILEALGLEPAADTPDAPAQVQVPQSVTMRQAQLALLGAGLLDDVEAAIAAIPGDAGRAAQITWDKSSAVERGNPLIGQLAETLGLDEAALDALFILAAGL